MKCCDLIKGTCCSLPKKPTYSGEHWGRTEQMVTAYLCTYGARKVMMFVKKCYSHSVFLCCLQARTLCSSVSEKVCWTTPSWDTMPASLLMARQVTGLLMNWAAVLIFVLYCDIDLCNKKISVCLLMRHFLRPFHPPHCRTAWLLSLNRSCGCREILWFDYGKALFKAWKTGWGFSLCCGWPTLWQLRKKVVTQTNWRNLGDITNV